MADLRNVRALMDKPANIRNVSVIAQVGHGKSTLISSLIQRAESSATEGDRALSMCNVGQESRMTIRSTATSLCLCMTDQENAEMPQRAEGNDFLINLIDTPGHVDFSSEVMTALRVTDGALIIVDCIEGVHVQTEHVLQQALRERVKPVLIVNKVDRAIFEFQLSQERLYQSFSDVIESINTIILAHPDRTFAAVQPHLGNVAFGSGLQGWSFTIHQFAKRYALKFGVDSEKMNKCLWGDNYFNPITRKWTRDSECEGEHLERGFNQFILGPIFKIFSTVMNSRSDISALLVKLGIEISAEERNLKDKQLLNLILQRFLPAADTLLEMTVIHLPSPSAAQAYRSEVLYKGPRDDEAATSIRSCDPNGPLMVYISKLVPIPYSDSFYAFGRVFSGTVRHGLEVRIQEARHMPGEKKEIFVQAIQDIKLMIRGNFVTVEDVPAGNLVSLIGIDQFLLQSGTLTTLETAHDFKSMSFSASLPTTVRRYVDVKDPIDLPKLVEGLKQMSKTDHFLRTTVNNSGEHAIAGTGELQLEAGLKDLEGRCTGIPLQISRPFVSYCESVGSLSSTTALSKSPNKYNRFYVTAEPLGERVSDEISSGKIDPNDNAKAYANILTNDHGWEPRDARKIWCFGPERIGPNVLVNQVKYIQASTLDEIRDSVVSGFQWATAEGPLAEEPIRSVRFNIVDVTLFSSNNRRGAGQIIPTVRRVIYAATLLANPSILEPIYLIDIQAPEHALDKICEILDRRGAHVFLKERHPGFPVFNIKAHLSVDESFGIAGELQSCGQESFQLLFDRYQAISGGSPLEPTTKPGQVVRDLRLRKGIDEFVPSVENFCDKI